MGWNYYSAQREAAIYDDSFYSEEIVEVQIVAGSSVAEIGALLEASGVISSGDLFRYYNSASGYGSQLQAGRYHFNIGMSIAAVTAKLVDGEVYRETFIFVIPEGSNIYQIAAAAERQGFGSAELFLEAAADSSLRQASDEVIFALEGYLFPATYSFEELPSADELLEIFYDEALRRLDRLEIPEDHPLSLDEIVILASILEKESQYDGERERVAGVFLNRLEIGMPLQSCATVQYLLSEFKEILSYEDTQIESPYNTYIYAGLPPGPISSPGELALEAVLHPEETDYLYFVVGSDGQHIFSHTYEEHLAAAAWLGE